MRHGRKVGDNRLSRNAFAQNNRQAALCTDEGFGCDHLLEIDHLPISIGQFDTHHSFARNGRDAGADRTHITGNIFGEANYTAGLDTGRRFQLVHGDHGAGLNCRYLALDVEIIEHGLKQPRVAFQRQLVERRGLIGRTIFQQFDCGKIVFSEQILL